VSGCAFCVSNANNVAHWSSRHYIGLPKFSCVPLPACHSLRLTPPVLHTLAVADDLVLSSAYVKTLDDWNKLISKLYQLSGNAVSPTAYKILCVRFVYFVRRNYTRSAIDATLDTGGWLDLTGQGLSPCKAHQASLGALTASTSGARCLRVRPRRGVLGAVVRLHCLALSIVFSHSSSAS